MLETALAWHEAGRKAAIATVCTTWGSAPRPAGSRLILRDDGMFAGSVSGGCVEGAVMAEAQKRAIENGESFLLEFGVADETAWEVGLSCGGKITVLVEPFDASLAKRMAVTIRARRPAVHLARVDGTARELLSVDEARTLPAAAAALERQLPELAEQDGAKVLIEPILPAWRMLAVGATHITQALAPMATAAGFEVTVVDPREAWAKAERFPGTKLVCAWPDEHMNSDPPDESSAVITLTHDPKIDDPALLAALAAQPRYIAALGSPRTHAKRRERLAEQGAAQEDIDRIRAPAGLDIGARGHAEIAVSILAETIAAFRGKKR